VGILTELLNNYKGFLTTKGTARSDFADAARTLANVFARILRDPTPENLETVWDFFVANKSGVMQESVALMGVTNLDKQIRFKTEIIYTLFRMAGNGVDVGATANVRTELVQSRLNSPALILFLQEKARVVAILKKQASA
jgi:hypothetical protein